MYMNVHHPAYAIKLSAKNFGFEDDKKDRSPVCRVLHLILLPIRMVCADRLLSNPDLTNHDLIVLSMPTAYAADGAQSIHLFAAPPCNAVYLFQFADVVKIHISFIIFFPITVQIPL